MVHETHESRKMTEIADAINDIMQSGETAQNGEGVTNMPPRHAEHTPPSPKPPHATAMPALDEAEGDMADTPLPDSDMPAPPAGADSTGAGEAVKIAEIGGTHGMEGVENDLPQTENRFTNDIDESTHDPIENQAAFAAYGSPENASENTDENSENNVDMDAGLEAAIAAEIAGDPNAQQSTNNGSNNTGDETNGGPNQGGAHAPTQADWSQHTDHAIGARQAVGALWETEETEKTEETHKPLSFAQTAVSETQATTPPAKDGTDLHTLSLRMRDTLADLKNDNPAQRATQSLFEQMKQTRDAMLLEMRTSIADFEHRAAAQQASIAQAVDQMNQEMADIRAELEMMVVRYHEQSGDLHKAYTDHFATERQRIGRYREFLQFLLRERGT